MKLENPPWRTPKYTSYMGGTTFQIKSPLDPLKNSPGLLGEFLPAFSSLKYSLQSHTLMLKYIIIHFSRWYCSGGIFVVLTLINFFFITIKLNLYYLDYAISPVIVFWDGISLPFCYHLYLWADYDVSILMPTPWCPLSQYHPNHCHIDTKIVCIESHLFCCLYHLCAPTTDFFPCITAAVSIIFPLLWYTFY